MRDRYNSIALQPREDLKAEVNVKSGTGNTYFFSMRWTIGPC